MSQVIQWQEVQGFFLYHDSDRPFRFTNPCCVPATLISHLVLAASSALHFVGMPTRLHPVLGEQRSSAHCLPD